MRELQTLTQEPMICPGSDDPGLATGYWDGAEAERRAMSEGTATAGGHLVPTPLAARVIDKARLLIELPFRPVRQPLPWIQKP